MALADAAGDEEGGNMPFGIYPGGMGKFFGPADVQFSRDIYGSTGGPYAAAASDSAADNYYASANNTPSFADMITGAGGDLFRKTMLSRGLANANTAGVQATNRNKNTGIQGAQNTTNAFANAKYGDYASQMGLEFAKNQRTNQNLGIFGGLAQPFFGAGGMLTGGPGSSGAIPQILGGSSGMPSMNIFSQLLGPGGLMGLFSGMGAGADLSALGAGETTAAGGFADMLPLLAAA